ncbi:universal stress protein [Pedobacter sp. G11]|uniref:universal stress protein n=1 Tax=Pedobacter sp. G11 TaxID=2482728 RepID=UPI000F5DD085|nr:universal stress protein [Pedobacter sp. G11]AZI26733.1 universal stress protein [Pedobacter sp. G11]
MKKIMVSTDLSDNSKSAVRMALRLAKLKGCALSVVQVNNIPKPFSWTQEAYGRFLKKRMNKLTGVLAAFVSAICHSIDLEPFRFKSVVLNSTEVVDALSDYARTEKFEYILIATRGAGTLKKLFGTHTSRLLASCKIPVIVVPSRYRHRNIKNVIYATDLQDIERELPDLVDFASPLGAEIQMLYMKLPFEGMGSPAELELRVREKYSYPITFIQVKRNIERSIIEDIDRTINKGHNSILALFSHHGRSGFDKLLFPSNAEQYSFYAKIPILVFAKHE